MNNQQDNKEKPFENERMNRKGINTHQEHGWNGEYEKDGNVFENYQKVIETKEIRLSPTIDVGDFNTKLKAARKFIMDGNKVKVSCRFRGRMIEHAENTIPLFNKFAEGLADIAKLDQNPYLDGRNMFMLLSPNLDKKKK